MINELKVSDFKSIDEIEKMITNLKEMKNVFLRENIKLGDKVKFRFQGKTTIEGVEKRTYTEETGVVFGITEGDYCIIKYKKKEYKRKYSTIKK